MAISTHPNLYKFFKAPTIEQIDEVIKKSGVSQTQFERFHGMYPTCIAHVRCGFRELPVKHWHLFLEEQPKRTNRRTNNIVKISNESKKSRKKKTPKLSHLVG